MNKVDVDTVKSQNPLCETVERLCGQPIVKHKIFAPWRAESTPSVHIYDNDSWHDFGSGIGGDIIDFVGYFIFGTAYDPATHFIDVVDRLGALEIRPLPPQASKPKPPKPQLKVSLEAITNWHESMPASRRAYWHSRGLTDQTIGEFLLGWDGKRYVIPALYRFQPFGLKRRITPEDNQREQALHQKFIDAVRLSHPEWVDEKDGKVYAYAVKELKELHPDWTDQQIDKAAPPAPVKYTSSYGSIPGIFNSDTLIDARTVIVCEGEIDAMLLHQSSIRAVSSTGGAGSWKVEWAKFFTHIEQVFVLFDNDKAGRDGARKVQASIRRSKLLSLPEGVKDVGELFEKSADAVAWVQHTMAA